MTRSFPSVDDDTQLFDGQILGALDARNDTRFVQVNEAPLTPYRFGGVTPSGNATDNTPALAAMFAAAASSPNPEIYLPPGIWNSTGASAGNLPLSTALKVRGHGRTKSRLNLGNTDNPFFTWNTEIHGVEMSSLHISTAGGDIFSPGPKGGINASTFRNMFLNTQRAGKRIWFQDNTGSFIQMTFEDLEMQHLATAAVSPFHVRTQAGGANFNLFKQVRVNGLNNALVPFFYFESSLPQTYLTDWVFMNILGEQNPGGLIHALAPLNWTVINATDEDATVPYVGDLFRFMPNAAGLAPRDLTFIGSGRRGSSMDSSAYEFNVATSSQNVTLLNCNPTPVSQSTKASLPRTATIIGGRGFPGSYQGQGSPEGVVTAAVGSMYSRSDGSAGSSIYIKESGTGATGWTAK